MAGIFGDAEAGQEGFFWGRGVGCIGTMARTNNTTKCSPYHIISSEKESFTGDRAPGEPLGSPWEGLSPEEVLSSPSQTPPPVGELPLPTSYPLPSRGA